MVGIDRGWESALFSAGVLAVALLAGVIGQALVYALLLRLGRRPSIPLSLTLVERLRRPSGILIPLLVVMLVAPSLSFRPETTGILQHLFSICFIAVIAWFLINATLACRDIIIGRYDLQAPDNVRGRAVFTQLTVLVRIVTVVVIIIAGATILMTFERIRQLGVSILASAGIVGIIAGFAAQRSIATLFGGLQIALTQPIRINDIVIVEGECGKVEEITLTYVVIKTWDLRRMVVPVTAFLEKSFQNWTRSSVNLLGTVFLYADYAVPVAEVRRKLYEILEQSTRWDRQAWGLQVTNATDRAVELRALVSAEDSSALWELRCEVREKLLAFLQETVPESLPRVRADISISRPAEDGHRIDMPQG